jgi:catechol 2,3-dioxygenase-like lactoylglutathione lyase family enzyme
MKPITLHHSSIRVSDVARAVEFYEGLLGLRAIPRPDFGFPGRWYGIGHGQLHLIQGDAPGGSLDPSGPHFAIAVEDLDAAAASWRAPAWRRWIRAAVSSGCAIPTATSSS